MRPRNLRNYFYALGKNIYWSIPPKYRQDILIFAFKNLGFFFNGIPRYEIWRNGQSFAQTNAQYHHNLLDIDAISPADKAGGTIAIHIHIFYRDLIKEFFNYLKNMPFPYDLYLSVPSQTDLEICQRTFTGLPFCRNIKIKQVVNRGRDIAPIFCAFGQELSKYDYIAHLHSKKSAYNKGATEGWREYLCNNLLGSEKRIRQIFAVMQGEESYGIVYPQNYFLVPSWANTWLANRRLGIIWCARLGINNIPTGYFDFPASSMFWARRKALEPLFNAGIELDDFPDETGQIDGTFTHCLERMFVLCSLKQDMPPGIIKDYVNPSWSAWRIDQFLNRPYESMVRQLNSSDIKLICFDIFDTLLCRPFLNPETIKRIVARRINPEAGQLYLEYRSMAEEQAREVKGLDVGLDEIYAHLSKLCGLSEAIILELRHLEEEIEKASLEPRQKTVSLFRAALATGKPVALITDMFLPRPMIETILRKNNIDGWDALFVSNEIGSRKDEGKLYEFVMDHYKIKPSEMLMVGDNERSDVQIPCDMGASFLHLMKPVELARGWPRLSNLIASHERSRDIDSEISLGLVVRKNFSPICYQDFDPDSLVQVTPHNVGYSLVGPLLVSFAEWLKQKSQQDGIDRLYFLSREGKLIKQVFDSWTEGEKDAPEPDYLIISRRAAGVAAILTLDDILEIARTIYYSNTIENYLYTRYGLRLTEERWAEIVQAQGWYRTTLVSVQGGKVEHLIPLLKVLQPEIFAKAQEERRALILYLTEKGLLQDNHQAVVDIGYGGSVQGYISKLITQKVNGFYLMTEERSEKVSRTYNVIIRGCFHENVTSSSVSPILLKYRFDLEKLLSSDEQQIEYYETDIAGNIKGNFRELLPEEIECIGIRGQLQAGVMDYVNDARRIRDTILPDYQPSRWTARMLLEAFFAEQSRREIDFLARIVLDDNYCGLGLVSQKRYQE